MTLFAFLAALAALSSQPVPHLPPPVAAVPTIVPPVPIMPPPDAMGPTLGWPSERPGRVISSPNWSDYRNYPVAAVRNDEEGQVGFILLIDEIGTPTQCAIRQSSGSLSLDAGTCALAKRMRFEPARDAQGRGIRSTYATKVFWLLDDPRPFASSSLDAELSFAGGQLVGCTAQGSGPYLQPWKQIVCRDAQIYPKKFAARGGIPSRLILSIRVDAGDEAVKPSWPAGTTLERDHSTFTVNGDGDASGCTAEADGDIFSNDYRSQNPCGHFLSAIWFEKPEKGEPARGLYELRLIEPK